MSGGNTKSLDHDILIMTTYKVFKINFLIMKDMDKENSTIGLHFT